MKKVLITALAAAISLPFTYAQTSGGNGVARLAEELGSGTGATDDTSGATSNKGKKSKNKGNHNSWHGDRYNRRGSKRSFVRRKCNRIKRLRCRPLGYHGNRQVEEGPQQWYRHGHRNGLGHRNRRHRNNSACALTDPFPSKEHPTHRVGCCHLLQLLPAPSYFFFCSKPVSVRVTLLLSTLFEQLVS